MDYVFHSLLIASYSLEEDGELWETTPITIDDGNRTSRLTEMLQLDYRVSICLSYSSTPVRRPHH